MNGLEILNNIWPILVLVAVSALTFTLVMFLIMTILYMPAFLQKKVNLKKAENIAQQNLEIVEKATFFETSTEFNELIEKQKDTIRQNAAKIKSQKAELEQSEKIKLKKQDKK